LLEGEDVDTYGRVVSWDDDEDAMMKTLSGLVYQPGEALLNLEIQQRIMSFLVKCCQAILHDVTSGSWMEASILAEPAALVSHSEWPTLATIAAEFPYRLPAHLDFHNIQNLVSGRHASAEDYIRALREDPEYFADCIGDWSEHRQEKLLDTNGDRHPILHSPLFGERVIGNAVTDAYGALVVWDIINQQLTVLSALQAKYSSVITADKMLPPEYMRALLIFRYTLNQVQKAPIAFLKTGFPASLPLRSMVQREPQDPSSTMIYVRINPKKKIE
jgi:hypothetical protein